MAIEFDTFHQWCVDRFGELNVRVKHTAHGVEICTHSPWSLDDIGKEDRKFKLWMSCEGGKKKVEHGTYRCWLTDRSGTLVDLVSKMDGISYEIAEDAIGQTPSLRALEEKALRLVGLETEPFEVDESDEWEPEGDVDLPDSCFRLSEMSDSDPWFHRGADYLRGRGLPIGDYLICTGSSEAREMRDRIVIPYHDRDRRLIFWNARAIDPKRNDRYQKPSGIDLDSVIFMTRWPEKGAKVYLMEGEFDAHSIDLAGFVAAACGGKSLSEAQIELLRGYRIVLAFDADGAGLKAVLDTGEQLLGLGFEVSYVRPPKLFKDWNKLALERGTQTLRSYLERFENRFTPKTSLMLRSSSI